MSDPSRKVLLLFSADPITLDFFRTHFSDEFVILPYQNELSLLESVGKTIFNFFIFDEKTPGVDLFKLTKTLKKREELKLIPFLLITTRLEKSYFRKAIQAGITEFLYEPLEVKQVKFHIAEAFKSQKIQEKMVTLSSQITPKPLEKEVEKPHHYNFLLNERAFKEVITAKKIGKPLALLLLQINHVETFPQSEEVINKTLADFLKHYLRPQDLLFPQGKGKLFIMLPKTSKRAAALIAESIQDDIEKKTFSLDNTSVKFTFSTGLGSFEIKDDDRKNPYEHFESLLNEVQNTLNRSQR
jgi:PleD family two-component response regulator